MISEPSAIARFTFRGRLIIHDMIGIIRRFHVVVFQGANCSRIVFSKSNGNAQMGGNDPPTGGRRGMPPVSLLPANALRFGIIPFITWG